jgi:hypothetical protein
VKSGVYSDLVGAIDHALADRFFVPSLTSLPVGSSHAVHYHTNDRDFLDGVARFARGVLRSGEPFVLVANAETRNGITQRLRNEGTDVSSFVAQGQYVELDTAKALSRFMRNGRPDAASLAEMVAEMEHLRITRGSGSRLTIFGDMARILCLDGNVEGAIELEQTWSRLTRDLPFLTVCSYSVDAFQAPKARELFPHVCAEHSAVTHALHA